MYTRRLIIGVLFLLFFVLLGLRPFLQRCFPLRFTGLIYLHSGQTEIDPLLVAALIQVESGFRPEAVSSKGAVGLMQLMPETAFWLAEKLSLQITAGKLREPDVNLKLGTFYLKLLLEEFPTEQAALAAYNAGPNNVWRWLNQGLWDGSKQRIEQIPFGETRAYVLKVGSTKRLFRYLYQKELGN